MRIVVVLLALMLGYSDVQAQQVVIPDGTEVFAETIDQISSANATEGDRIQLRVETPVVVNGVVVIAQGTIVHGIVSDVGRRGRMGRSGRINIRVESTSAVDGQRVSLRASKGGEGEGRVGTTVALTVLFGPLGLLKSGKDAVIRPGTKITTYTNERLTVAVNSASAPAAPAALPTVAIPTSLAGLWIAEAGTRVITLSIIDDGSAISGSGDITDAGQSPASIVVTGVGSATDVALTLVSSSSRYYLSAKRMLPNEMQGTLATAGAPDMAVTFRRR